MKVIPYRRRDDNRQPASLYLVRASTLPPTPRRPLLVLPHPLWGTIGPVFGHEAVGKIDDPLTRQHAGEVRASLCYSAADANVFSGDPGFAYDPILQSLPDQRAQQGS